MPKAQCKCGRSYQLARVGAYYLCRCGLTAKTPKPKPTFERNDKPLTRKQVGLLCFLEWYCAKTNSMPTVKEIAIGLNVRRFAVQEMLKRLEAKGYVRLQAHTWRGIRLLRNASGVAVVANEG